MLHSRLLVALVLTTGVLSACSGTGTKLETRPPKSSTATRQESPYGFPWGEYGLGIPGVAYEIDQGDKIVQVTASGRQTASTLRLNPDGTYVWNSQWDGKTYKGTYQKGSGDYPILIPGAQEGKTWHVGKEKDGNIYVYDGSSIYYIGKWMRP